MKTNDEAEKVDDSAEEMAEGSVKVPESFQKSADSLISSATKPMLEYLRSCIMERESTLRKGESKREKAGAFDIEGMPG